MAGKEAHMPGTGGGNSLARRCYQRAHPVTWLRWLRAGALAAVAAAVLLAWLETAQAHQGITLATERGVQAVADGAAAQQELQSANDGLQRIFTAKAVVLTGPGQAFTTAVASAAQDLVLAAGDNVAGPTGGDQIQFAEGQLSTYRDQVNQAADDLAAGDPLLAQAELGYATTLATTLGDSLRQLGLAELSVVNASLSSRWLNPALQWVLLLIPLTILLALTAWTSYVLAVGFRRLVSVPLILAVLLALAFTTIMAAANAHDSQNATRFVDHIIRALPAPPAEFTTAGPDASASTSAWTLLAAAALAACAAILAFASYRPRLLEYRSPS
jgi:hypothetical protein